MSRRWLACQVSEKSKQTGAGKSVLVSDTDK